MLEEKTNIAPIKNLSKVRKRKRSDLENFPPTPKRKKWSQKVNSNKNYRTTRSHIDAHVTATSCDLCGKPFKDSESERSERRFDHCHDSDLEVDNYRGTLCNRCNVLEGIVRRNVRRELRLSDKKESHDELMTTKALLKRASLLTERINESDHSTVVIDEKYTFQYLNLERPQFL